MYIRLNYETFVQCNTATLNYCYGATPKDVENHNMYHTQYVIVKTTTFAKPWPQLACAFKASDGNYARGGSHCIARRGVGYRGELR